ncbi:MAG: pyridoxal phosphate-dependent decarboxylase family protein, partial [Saprospiraceae bacterium]
VNADTFTPDISAYENAIDENTILIVGSAPSYAHGVVDPIHEIAALAKSKNILCHVDACVGGMYLPFAKRIGSDIPDFDFSVEGVTSISMDFHKYGYTAKGASCILYKNKELRKYQIYTCSEWSGYSIVNPTVLSSKTGGSLAACWANLHFLGSEGYEKIVRQTEFAKSKVVEAIKKSEDLILLGNPIMNMIAFSSENVDLFSLVQKMREKGWYIQLQFKHGISPTNIHLSINQANVPHIDEFISDLNESIHKIKSENINTSLPIPTELLAQLTPEMVNNLKEGLGVGDGEAPQDLTLVNRILDAAPPHIRDMILKEFVNGLYR